MSRQILEKYVYCSICKKQSLVHIDLNHIKMEMKTGVTKRTIPHSNHLLLLEIDGNGDIRNETAVELELSNQDIVDIGDILSRILVVSTHEQAHRIVIFGRSEKYTRIMSQIIDAGLATDLNFSFVSNNHFTRFVHQNLSIIITELMDEVYKQETIDCFILYANNGEPTIVPHLLNLLPDSNIHIVASEEVGRAYTDFFQNSLGVHKVENWQINELNRLKIFELALAQLANPEVD